MENTFEVDTYEQSSAIITIPNLSRHRNSKKLPKSAARLLRMKCNNTELVLVMGSVQISRERYADTDSLGISARFWRNVKNLSHREWLKKYGDMDYPYDRINFPRLNNVTTPYAGDTTIHK